MSYLGLVLNTCSGSGSGVADSEPAALEPERKRGKAWLAWEDRALAKQVLADDPILNRPGGKKEDCWREVALNLSRKMNMNRSGSSCKNRMDLLVELHRKADTRSKQKTCSVEEVDLHVRNMTDICMLFDSVSTNTEIRQKAKDKLTARKEKAIQLRIASMSSQVRKRDLMEAGDPVDVLSGIETVETANGEPCRKRVRAPKNQFANEVEGVLAGLKEKSEAFRNAILERERRDREREEREKKGRKGKNNERRLKKGMQMDKKNSILNLTF